MPKKSIEINPFDGGLNNYADARDIKENELAAASNLNTDQPGRIKIGKRIHSVAARTGADDVQTGLGLFHYSSDYAANNTEANTEYQVLFNSSTNHLLRRTLSDANFTSLVALGAAYTPVYYSIDGSLKLSDQTLSSDSKFLGVTDVNYFGEAQDNFFTTTNAYIDPPTDGDLTKDPADGTDVPPSQNTGHLDWIVQQKTGSKSDWFSFDKNDTNDTALRNTTIGGIINQYSSTTNTDLTQTEYDSDTTYVLSSDSGISAVSGQMYKAIKGSGSSANGVDYNRVLLRFDSSSPKSYEEKSIFISLYFTSAVKNNLKSGAVKIRVGNNIQAEGTSGNDCYVYEFGSNQITADDWTVLELVHGQHDEVEGNPNASGLDHFQVVTEYLSNSSSNTTYYLDNLQIGDSSRGLWNGRYKFFQSYIYDGSQESNTFLLNGQSSPFEVEEKILQFRCHGLRGSGAAMGGSRRVTGANLYYVEYDLDNNPLDTDKKLLIHVDMEKGVKKVGGETFEVWGDAKGSSTGFEAPYNSGHTSYLQIMDPPVLETFSTNAGYDEDDKLKKMKYKAATVMNRRAYVGNVKVTDSANKEIKYSDRIYKSEPNKVDLFTELSYVDVAVNDGESITALASFGDILLQFKERTLYLINCTQEIEYLEDTAKFRGVWGQAAVCETDSGIVWVNKFGLFLFDGREVTPLIEGKIDPDNWNSIIGGKPMVGFTPLDRKVLVVGDADAGSKGFTYSLKSKGFNFMTHTGASGNLFNSTGDDMSNMVSSNAGILSWYQDSGSNITEYKWDTATGDVYIDIQTRDQDFKDPARRKMVKNVYLTYKLSENENGTSIPTIKYLTNGGSTEYAFDAALQKNHGDWYTQTLKPNVKSQASNVYSFQIRIYGVCFEGFEINDINVVYRDKVLK